MQLRGYQEEALKNVKAAFKRVPNVLLVSPTGSGKSVMGAVFALRHKGKRILWVAHREELLRQARAEIIAAGVPERDVGILCGAEKCNPKARIMVCSVDFARRQAEREFDLIIIDEAHRTPADSYQEILDAHACPVLGMTATPCRLDNKPLGETYDEMVIAANMTELEIDGYIAKPKTYGVSLERAAEMVRGVRKQGGDYARGALSKRMMSGKLMGDVVSETQRLAPGRRTLVFAASRQHGRELTARFLKSGRKAAYLDGKTPAGKRKTILEQLRTGEIEVVVNVDVLTEGFDLPAIGCVVLARPTKSLTRFLQPCGRASRPYKGQRPIILDHAGNCHEFGCPNDPRDWDLKNEAHGGVCGPGRSLVKQCAECEQLIPLQVTTCPECGAEQPKSRKELEEEAAELERLRIGEQKKKEARERFMRLAEMKGLDDEWVDQMTEKYWQEAVG